MSHRPKPPARAAALTRRQFMQRGAGLGLALGMPPLVASCGGDDDGDDPASEHQTFFFNLSHEATAGRSYYLTGGGQRHLLVETARAPHVLRRERRNNAFLRAVPDAKVTHHVEGFRLAQDGVTLAYVSSDIDSQAGTWQMSSVQLLIPPKAAETAYREARKSVPSGALPLSAKRRLYGVDAAQTEDDLRGERQLLDSASHAATLVGAHPDLMSLEPGSAHVVHSNHVDRDFNVYLLGQQLQQPQYGPAQPQAQSGQPNGQGWATLQPVPGDGGAPLKNVNGRHAGRIQYQPSLHPALQTLAAAGMSSSIPSVKNDPALGTDVTGLDPSGATEPNPALSGALWSRRDGVTKVDQSGVGAGDGSISMVMKHQNAQNGYVVSASSTTSGSVTSVQLTILNWFLQFRGVWLQFLDANGNVIALADIPEYAAGTIAAQHDKDEDTANAMFVSVIGPVFTVFAIPTAPGFIQPKFNVPQKASTVRILSSGLSYSAGNAYSDTVLQGAIMTGVFNYGATAMMAAAGAGPLIPALYKVVVIPLMRTLVAEIIAAINTALNPNGDKSLVGEMLTPNFWISQALIVAKLLVTQGASEGLKALSAFIATSITEGVAEDAIPVAGEIMQALSIAIGGITLAETSVELALTPWTYVDDLVFTRDLSVTILRDSGNPNGNPPDPGDDTFPKAATGYTVTAMFDDGTPYVQRFSLPTPVPSTLPPVVFPGVPAGGSVNVSVAFVQQAATPGQLDILLGRGTSGLVPNVAGNAPSFQIEELAFPISANTQYRHRQKTSLDANGNHLWAALPAPTATAATSQCGAAGTICGYRSLSVRQGSGSARGYLGYSWGGQNSDPNIGRACIGGGIGQLDQIANLNTDSGNGGANAQQGYLVGNCGYPTPGVRVAYSLLTHGSANFYVDTSDNAAPMIRQVLLEPAPQYLGPQSGQCWGVLNFASDMVLLHPAGHIVSLSGSSHKLETHRLPPTWMADADAKTQLVAQLRGGKGSQPGRLDTPVAAAVSADGVILVLELGNNRIQALDLGGNPVRHFNKQTAPNASPYSLTLTATDPNKGWQYLDLAVEYTGYLYVLSYNTTSYVYRLDLYHPDQPDGAPISTTQSVNGARLAVDFWRNVYTLNYEILQLPNGSAAGLTEPSVSLWTPCDVGDTC